MIKDTQNGQGPHCEALLQENSDQNEVQNEDNDAEALRKTENDYPPETENFELSVPIPPDGGYGWVVCACAFLVMLMLDGMLFTFGVTFLDLLDYFNESKSKTALVGSVLMGTHLLVGPLTSALVNAWGIRPVAIAGSCLAAGSFAASSLAPSVNVLIFTYGILGGIGLSMAYIPSIFAVGFYFEKRRALANGIANSGSGVGTFVFAPLCAFLQDTYGWRGALLIISGLVLNCAVFVSMYRPLEQKKVRRCSLVFTVAQTDCDSLRHTPGIGLHKDSITNGSIPNVRERNQCLISNGHAIMPDTISPNQGIISIKPRALKTRIIKSNTTDLHPKVYAGSTLSFDDIKLTNGYKAQQCANISMMEMNHLNFSNVSLGQRRHLTGDMLTKPLYRKDIFYSGSVAASIDNVENIGSYYHGVDSSEQSLNETQNHDVTIKEDDCRKHLYKGLKLVAGFSILKIPVFLLAVAMSILWTTHSAVLTILPNYATLNGISTKDASILVSFIGIFNIIGRVMSGWMADRFDCIVINATALFMDGVANLLIPWTVNYYLLCVLSSVFGLGMGSWTSLRPIVLVHILGIDNLTNAFGVLAMFQGAAFCIGPPVAGLFYEYTKSYKLPFTVAGCAFLTSCVLCIPLYKMGKSRRGIPVGDDIIVREIPMVVSSEEEEEEEI